MSTSKRVTIYDTTLRDGTQGLGFSLSSSDKLRIAEKLDSFGVDYVEGGWPGSNPKDIEFFQEAAKRTWKNAKVAAFGSTRRKDTPVEKDDQVRLLVEAQTPVVTIYGKSWKMHVTEVLNTTEDENRAMIRDTCRFLKSHGKEVIYDAEHFFDGFKDDAEHALSTLQAAKEGGADMLVLCDTNGGTMPHEVAEIVKTVCERLQHPVGMHTHDDSGVAAANALAGVLAGAVQVQGTINGYGERTGNCNMTTVMPCLQLKMGIPVVPDLTKLTELSHFVDDVANCAHNPRAPFIGSTCFSHKGGTHVNAIQKVARSYEHIEPGQVGNKQYILVSELAGQSNILMKAEAMGIPLEKGSPLVKTLLTRLKDLEKEGYEFEAAEASFELLIRNSLEQQASLFDSAEYECVYRRDGARNYEACLATVKLQLDGEPILTVAEGDGPVNALDGALRKALSAKYPGMDAMKLSDYKVRIIDGHAGTAAKTRVLIDSTDGQRSWSTVGVSSNIIDASWRALTDSMAFFLLRRGK